MNGLYLLGFGPRTAMAARDLSRIFYPALSAGLLPSEQDAARFEVCHR
jgi:iron complex transport system substrate-binding protein